MKTMRAAMAITVMAVIGLVVSVIAGWSQLTADSPAGQQQLGPPVVRVPEQRPEPEDEEAVGLPSDVGRSRAVPIQEDQQPYRPVRITVDAVGIDSVVRAVGVAADGQMELPPNPEVLGWYRFGPAPGAAAAGSAVLAGHLDSRRYGIGPLVRLRDVEPGDLVEVALSDGSRTTYRVEAVTRYDQQALPAELFARDGAPRLRLITCGGDYDVDAGGYQQNLVVTAVPT
jgi:hypothetical protein